MRIFITFFAVCLLLAQSARAQAKDDAATEAKINDLLGKMTLDEKLGQLSQVGEKSDYMDMAHKGMLGSMLGSLGGAKHINEIQKAQIEGSRFKIPALFGFDVIHGYRTIFPIPLAETASWDPDLARQSSAVAAAEAAASGIKWTFAPMVDIARDPRWGRVAEGSGEDPYLGAAMARARVEGFQGKDPSAPDKVLATAKHWVAYGAAEGGRDYNTTEVSERTLREIYFPPFKAALDAGVGTFMSSFNDLNGIPATANAFTLTQVLRGEWKFNGFVVSDYQGVDELIPHGVAKDGAQAAQKALNAGVDMEMVSRDYAEQAPELIRQGKVTLASVNEAVRHVLLEKFRLGLFDHPYVDEKLESSAFLKPEYLALAKRDAARSLVLLKNQGNVLPISPAAKTIAVVGPLADDAEDMLGTWRGVGKKEDAVSLLAAMRRAAPPGTTILTAKSGRVESVSAEDIAAAVAVAKKADIVVAAVGESANMSGEAASRSSIELTGKQVELLKSLAATDKPVVAVLMNGRPLALEWAAANIPALLEAWHGGVEAGPAIADALFGKTNPGGKLPMTFPRVTGEVPVYYNHMNTGRPGPLDDTGGTKYISRYADLPAGQQGLYPFGYGLSYTTFSLHDLTLSAPTIRPDGTLTASVTVRNDGQREGDEVVQLYIHRLYASVTRPVRELKGFQRVTLKPGESTEVSFQLGPQELTYLDENMKPVVEPGTFDVYVGTSSVGGLKASFDVVAP